MRTLLIPFLALGLWLVVAEGVRAQDEARAILEKAIKAHGGADKIAKEKATQTKTKGTLELSGGLSFTEETSIQPNRLKSVVQLEVGNQTIKIVTVFDGKNAWVQAQGNTMELTGKILDEVKESSYLASLSTYAFLKDKEYEVSSIGEIKVNNRPAVGVKVAHKGHRDINFFFDKQTGLLAKMERQMVDPMTETDVTEERIITEYQEVDGLKVAKKALVNRDGKKYVEAEVLEVKFRDKFDDSEFAKP
jgi:hypothetical protein